MPELLSDSMRRRVSAPLCPLGCSPANKRPGITQYVFGSGTSIADCEAVELRGLRPLCHGGDLLRNYPHFFSIQHEYDLHRRLHRSRHREAHIVERILPEYVELERERVDALKSAELKQLTETVPR